MRECPGTAPAMSREKKRQVPIKSRICAVPGCGRRAYAQDLCQTHHRQMMTVGRVKPIRPYRKRSQETIKFAGLRLTPACAQRIRQHAEREGSSFGAVIAEILEGALVRR
jgi:hypothetical protein